MSTHYREPHGDPHGDLLARALRAEAESIVPAGDGLTKIRDRVATRRARFRWFLPSASVVTAAALAGIAFGAYSVTNNDDTLRTQQPAHHGTTGGGPTASVTSTTPSASASSAPGGNVVAGYQGDVTPVWPFRSAAEVRDWQSSAVAAGQPWRLSAPLTARSFLSQLQLPDEKYVVVKDTATGHVSGDVTLATNGATGQRVVGTVHLVRWGSGARVPWEVTGVDSAGASIDSPSNDASVSSPVTVRYTLDGGNEDDVRVSVYDGWTEIGTRTDSAGGGQHTATVSYTGATSSVGYVVVADAQSGSGTATLQRLLVTPVRFSSPTIAASSPSTQKYPTYFVAVKDGRLAVFYAKGGGFARWLTDGTHRVTDPQLDDSHTWVYYLQDPNHLMRVKTTGGSPQSVVTGEFNISAFAVGGASDDLLAYVRTSMDTAGGHPQMTLYWQNSTAGVSASIAMPDPPTAEQLAWDPDGRHLAATVRTGNAWGIRIYDTRTAKTWSDGVALPCPAGQSCSAPSYDAAGRLYFVASDGATTWSVLQWTGSEVKHVSTWDVTTPISPEMATNDFTPDAEAAIVGTDAGEIYRIEHGVAVLLATRASQPTW